MKNHQRRSCHDCKHLSKCLEERERQRAKYPRHVADGTGNEPILDAVAEICKDYERKGAA